MDLKLVHAPFWSSDQVKRCRVCRAVNNEPVWADITHKCRGRKRPRSAATTTVRPQAHLDSEPACLIDVPTAVHVQPHRKQRAP